MVRTKESQSRLASEPVQPPNPKGFKQLQEPKLISTWTDAIAWQQDYCVQDCHVTPDTSVQGPRDPHQHKGLEAAGAHGEGLLHPPPANP